MNKKITSNDDLSQNEIIVFFRFFNLSKLINHSNIVTCFGYVNVSPERCLLVSEYSRINLFDHCQTMSIDHKDILT